MDPLCVATGPLTSDSLAEFMRERLGTSALAFYDAIAPIVSRDSIDESIAFTASRYDRETMEGADEDGAYLNCPMNARGVRSVHRRTHDRGPVSRSRVRRSPVLRRMHAGRGRGETRR